MTIKYLKTIITNRGRYAKRSMRKFFIFFSLILGLSLLTNACRSKDDDPPDSSMPPQQVVINSVDTSDTDSIAVTWALDASSMGEALVGVVAVLSTENLGVDNACQEVPGAILTHARDGSGSGSETSGDTRYMAVNDADGSTLAFTGLRANTTYSLAICSVSAAKIRGDNTGGAANQAVVQSIMTGQPSAQVTIGSTTLRSNLITFEWALDPADTSGDTVVGVVAVLKAGTDPLPVDSVCADVPMEVLDHARDDTMGSRMGTSGDNMYLADNDPDGNTLTFPALSPATTYSLALCSVSADNIRGDGSESGNAVVQSVMTDFLPPQQIKIAMDDMDMDRITAGLDSIEFTWDLDATADMATVDTVVGVVAVLSTGSLEADNVCASVPMMILDHARGDDTENPTLTDTDGGITYIADNRNTTGALMFGSLTPATAYTLAICSVSANKIRGDGNADGDDANAIVRNLMTDPPPQQVKIATDAMNMAMITARFNSISITWELDPISVGETVEGVVAVLREEGASPLMADNACADVSSAVSGTTLANILDHARSNEEDTTIMNPMSGTDTVSSITFTYIADNRDTTGTLTFDNLAPNTTYSIAVCSVSADKIRADGNPGGGDAVLLSQGTDYAPPQQVEFSITMTGIDFIELNWDLVGTLDTAANSAVQGAVAVLRQVRAASSGPPAVTAIPALMASDVCQTLPSDSGMDVLAHARGSDSTPLTVTTGTGATTITYMADNSDDDGTLRFTGLTDNTMYSVAVCSVSANDVRGDGNADGDNADAVVQNQTTDSPPKQAAISMLTTSLNSIAFNWSASSGMGEDLVGVVAVLSTGALNVSNACAEGTLPTGMRMIMGTNTSIDVLAHARASSESMPLTVTTDSGPTYIADNRNSGTLSFEGLPISITYNLVVCSVSAMKIRGDGTGGTANQALVVTGAVTDTPAKQVDISLVRRTTSLTATWSVALNSHSDPVDGDEIVGAVAVLRAGSRTLNERNICQALPTTDNMGMSVDMLGHARGDSGENLLTVTTVTGTVTTTYIADNRNGGFDRNTNTADSNEISFLSLTPNTIYSLVICSVSSKNLRGDGTTAMSGSNTIVNNAKTTIILTGMNPFPKQVMVTPMTMAGSASITASWSVDTDSAGREVVGVVGVLRLQPSPPDSPVALDAEDVCVTTGTGAVSTNILTHARTAPANPTDPPTITTAEVDGVRYIADNRDMGGTLTFSGLTNRRTYSLAVCSVAYNRMRTYIRGDGIEIDADGEPDDTSGTIQPAVVFTGDSNISVTSELPVKQVTVSAAAPTDTTDIDTIEVSWSVPDMIDGNMNDGENVVGIVAVVKEQPDTTATLEASNACGSVPMSILNHARGTSASTTRGATAADGTSYIGDNRDGSSTTRTTMVSRLEPGITFSIVVCAVSFKSTGNVLNIRGDGNTVLDDDGVLVSATTNVPVSPKQVEFAMVNSIATPVTKTSTQITVGWSVPTNIMRGGMSVTNEGQSVVGVVAVAYLSDRFTTSAVNVCDRVPSSVLTHARAGTGSASGTSGMDNNVRTYMAEYDEASDDMDDMGSLTIMGLKPGTMYHVAVCSVSTGAIRGDAQGRIDGAEITSSPLMTPGVVIIYKSESVLGNMSDTAVSGGNFTSDTTATIGVGTGICAIKRSSGVGGSNLSDGVWGLPEALEGSGFSNHTFYGSTTGTNGNFVQLPARLGADADKAKREVWVFHTPPGNNASRQVRTVGDSTLRSEILIPSEPVTLAQLIALGSDGNYTNQAAVERVFRLLQNGGESVATNGFEHWSFTGKDGEVATRNQGGSFVNADCATDGNVPGTSTSDRAAFGRHDNADGDSYIGGTATDARSGSSGVMGNRQTACTDSDKTVLCIARQDSGF